MSQQVLRFRLIEESLCPMTTDDSLVVDAKFSGLDLCILCTILVDHGGTVIEVSRQNEDLVLAIRY